MRLEGVETRVTFTGTPHPSIKPREVCRPRDPQRWAFALDAPRPEHRYSVHNNSLNNLLRGLNERVFFTDSKGTLKLKPVDGAFLALNSFVEGLKTPRLVPWTLKAFVDSYTGSQRTRYEHAADSLALMPWSTRDANVATFVKCEKINFSQKDDPAPRIIQPRNPRFNAAIGPFIKPLEKLIYKQLSKLYKLPCVAKGFDVYQTGDIIKSKWELFKQPCAISLDASRFDQHCSVEALKWTHDVYKSFCNDDEFARLLNEMLTNKGHGVCKDGFVKYEVEGCRMSGDMDTALGNCLLMVAMTYSLCKHLGITHEVMDNGDDITVIMDRDDAAAFIAAVPEWYARLGFKMKIEEPVHVLEHIEFCQMHPVYDGFEWRMVRNLNALCKDLVCTTNQQQVDKWIEAIGNGGLALTAGMPVYQAFYQWLAKFGARGKKNNTSRWKLFQSSGFFRLSGLVKRAACPISVEARESFERAFGMGFAQQQALEQVYDGLSTGPLGINHTDFNCLQEHSINSPYIF